MYFVNGKDDHEILLVDSEKHLFGQGCIYEFLEAEIYNKDRMGYYILAQSKIEERKDEIKRIIVTELINRAIELRRGHAELDARVYNCCFSDNREEIEFYKTIEGFKHDEGMHILSCNLDLINSPVPHTKYVIAEDSFDNDENIQSFLIEHGKVFRNNPYNVDKIQKLRSKEGFKNIAIFDQKKMIGNILLFVEEESGQKLGWLEDLFVSKGYRNEGLGEFLVIRGLNYFKSIGLHESRLEMWSANKRASNLYLKIGYKLLMETESSIGMAI